MSAAQVALLFSMAAWLAYAQDNPCVAFQASLKSTYNFSSSKLNELARKTKTSEMDGIWAEVKAHPKELVPCLESALADPVADSWFLFDGSALLATVDPSPKTNQLLLRGHEKVNLDDLELVVWVHSLTRLALADIDISAARWMVYPNARYFLPQHAFTVTREAGAFFLYGSMDERQATPALQRIASDVNHAARNVALGLLIQQSTPQALDVLRSLDVSGFSVGLRKGVQEALRSPKPFRPRLRPKTTRAQFITAFEAITNGDFGPFNDLVEHVPDGEKDVVAVMRLEDLPLIRKVRRCLAATGNPHQIEMYPYFTGIIQTLLAGKPAA